jgi:hypothetical protein
MMVIGWILDAICWKIFRFFFIFYCNFFSRRRKEKSKKRKKNTHQLLCLAQQLASQHHNARRPIPDLFILDARDVDQDLRGGVVDVDRAEDRRAVIRDRDSLAAADRLEDLVHPFGTQGRLDEVGDRHGSHKGGLSFGWKREKMSEKEK